MVTTRRGEPARTDTDVDKPCDTCGGSNRNQAMNTTCSKCGMLRHNYCMMIVCKESPEAWVCEECLSGNALVLPNLGEKKETLNPSASIHSTVSGLPMPHRKLKAVRTGKVKFLPTEEVLKLSINSPKNFRVRSGLPNSTTCSKRNPVQLQRVLPKISFLDLKEKPDVKFLRPAKPFIQCAAPINAKPNQSPAKFSNGRKGETSYATAENEISIDEDKDLLDFLPKLDLYRTYLPAVEATWMGGFKVFGTANTPVAFYSGFEGQLACRVHPKAFEFSQKLPIILQVKLLPLSNVQPDLFGNGCPDFHDIALYIFPSDNIERAKHNNSSLLELLETQRSVLRCYVDGVELLIFTSKQLHVDSQRFFARSNIGDFLWAVFRCRNTDIHLSKLEEITSLVPIQEHASDDDVNTRGTEIIDMDIDMEGGKEVGRVDIVIPKELHGKDCRYNAGGDLGQQNDSEHKKGKCNESGVVAKSSEVIKEMIVFEQTVDESGGNLRSSEDESELPPGFGEQYWMDTRKNGSSAKDYGKKVIQETQKENLVLPGVSDAGFGGCGAHMQRYSKDSLFTGRMKLPQELASDLAHDPFSPYGKNHLKIEGCQDENLVITGDKKQLKIMSFPDGRTDSLIDKQFAKERRRLDVPNFPRDQNLSWSSPPENWVKLSTKGSSMGESGPAGAAGVVTDKYGKWILGYAKTLGNDKSLTAELWALYLGLDLVWQRGFRTVQVESSSEEVVKCLEQDPAFLDPNRSLIQSCRDYLRNNWICKLKHTREVNSYANWLASHTQERPLGTLTVFENPP